MISTVGTGANRHENERRHQVVEYSCEQTNARQSFQDLMQTGPPIGDMGNEHSSVVHAGSCKVIVQNAEGFELWLVPKYDVCNIRGECHGDQSSRIPKGSGSRDQDCHDPKF